MNLQQIRLILAPKLDFFSSKAGLLAFARLQVFSALTGLLRVQLFAPGMLIQECERHSVGAGFADGRDNVAEYSITEAMGERTGRGCFTATGNQFIEARFCGHIPATRPAALTRMTLS